MPISNSAQWVDRVQVITPDNVLLEYELAGPSSRLLALLADLVLQIAGWLLLAFLLVKAADVPLEGSAAALVMLALFAISWGYSVYFEVQHHGQTPGKMAAGIRVIRSDGMPVGLREASLRSLLSLVDGLPTPTYALGGLVSLRDAQSRRIGDMVAGTLVIRESSPVGQSRISGAIWAARAEKGQANQGLKLPGGTVSAQKIAILEQFWERRESLGVNRRQELAEKLMKPLWVALQPDGERPQGSAEKWIGEILKRVSPSETASVSTTENPQTAKRGPLF